MKDGERVILITNRHGNGVYNPVWNGSEGCVIGTVEVELPKNPLNDWIKVKRII